MTRLKIHRVICMLLCLAGSMQVYSQYASSEMFIQDLSGKPIDLRTSYNVIGSEDYPEKYTPATMYLIGGKAVQKALVRIHLMDHSVFYTNKDNIDMVAVSPIERIDFEDVLHPEKPIVFKLFNTPDDLKVPKKFYQVLYEGKIKLLKLYVSDYTDTKDYGSATVTRTYQNKVFYYLYDDALKTVKRIGKAEDLLSVIPTNDRNKVTAYITTKKPSIRKEKDLIDFCTFYQGLH